MTLGLSLLAYTIYTTIMQVNPHFVHFFFLLASC